MQQLLPHCVWDHMWIKTPPGEKSWKSCLCYYSNLRQHTVCHCTDCCISDYVLWVYHKWLIVYFEVAFFTASSLSVILAQKHSQTHNSILFTASQQLSPQCDEILQLSSIFTDVSPRFTEVGVTLGPPLLELLPRFTGLLRRLWPGP